jgi:hypothetical protein
VVHGGCGPSRGLRAIGEKALAGARRGRFFGLLVGLGERSGEDAGREVLVSGRSLHEGPGGAGRLRAVGAQSEGG